MNYEWYERQVLQAVERRVMRNMDKAATNTAQAIAQDLSTPGPPASSPGQPPHKISGDLVGAVDSTEPVRTSKGIEARAGVLDQDQWPKAIRLARGYVGTDRAGRTFNQKPRPILGSVTRRRKQILREIARG